ncbi:MAG: SHOCT domain-containing protein [Chloroflexi bacterium]|nr:SHOCT domain-containing protein [Chloroflexota bacterium]
MWGFEQSFQWWMPFFGMGMMLFMVAIVGLVVWGISRFMNDRRGGLEMGDTPDGILEKRLARGEISSEQFQELQELLQAGKGRA